MQQAKQSKRKPNKTRNVSFMSKTAQLFSKARIFLFNSASVIANAVKKTAAVKGLDLSEVRDYTFALAKSILGFLLGMAALPQGIRPFRHFSALLYVRQQKCFFYIYRLCVILYYLRRQRSFLIHSIFYAFCRKKSVYRVKIRGTIKCAYTRKRCRKHGNRYNTYKHISRTCRIFLHSISLSCLHFLCVYLFLQHTVQQGGDLRGAYKHKKHLFLCSYGSACLLSFRSKCFGI